MTRIALTALLAVPLLAAGCGGADRAGAGSQAAKAPATALNVTVWADAAKADTTARSFSCASSQSSSACAALAKAVAGGLFAPLPQGTMCTQIYGGPGKAHVTGTVDGRAVDATFTRANGCEVGRWQKLVDLGVLPAGGAAVGAQ